MLRDAVIDLRFTWRLVRRSPALTAAVLLTIASGIAAATAMASVINSVFLTPLPFAKPEQLVQLSTRLARSGRVPETNALDAADVRERTRSLASLGLYDLSAGTVRVDGGLAQSVTVLGVDAGLQQTLGVVPVAGRLFTQEELTLGGPRVAILGHRFWRAVFGGDLNIVGRTIEVGPGRAVVVGVLPLSADRFPAGGSDLWTPLVYPSDSFLNQRGSMALSAIARLAPGTTLAGARAELAAISSQLATAHPETNRARSHLVSDLQEAMVGPVRTVTLLLAAAVAVLLAVACANIANLLLAQAHARSLEFAVRGAIGAGRGRLLRQLWTETLALFVVAGAAGIAFAMPLARGVLAWYPDALPLATDVELDPRVGAIAVLVTLGAALLAGLPRARGAATAVGDGLAAGGRGSLSRKQRRAASTFVAIQVALSMVLLFGGLVLLRTFMNIASVGPGFDASEVLTIRAAIPAAARRETPRMLLIQDQLRDRAASLPGVESAAHAMFIPFTGGAWGDGYRRAGEPAPDGPTGPMAHFFMVSPEYFEVMRLPILRGRSLTADDDADAPRVILVSETFARTAFPGQDPIGRRIDWNDATWEIVGLTRDARHASLWSPMDADVYVPRHQVPRGNTWLVVRTMRPAAAILAELQPRAEAIVPGILLSDARSMEDRLAASTALERFRAVITSGLALLTLALALAGLHAIVAYMVVRRTREIGIRMALGEGRSAIRARIVGDALRTLGAGLIPGAAACWLLGRWLQSLEIVRADMTVALAAVSAIFVAAAIVAAAGPAWRASRLDAMRALRAD